VYGLDVIEKSFSLKSIKVEKNGREK